MGDSPFGPVEGINRRELKFHEKLFRKTVEKADEFYIDSIPSDDVKAMPPRYMYPIGGFILTILLCVFIAVFLPSYLQAIHQKYLAPGSTSSTYCNQVSISNSGDYLATQNGYWIGGTEFQYSLSSYVLSVQNLNVNTEQFNEMMNQIYTILVDNGQIFKTQDLGVNLLYWMAFTLVSSLSAAQRFYLVGNPVIVFDREITVGSLSNEFADCDLEAYSTFDQANGLMTLTYSYDEFVSNPTCNTTLSPDLFGYFEFGNSDDLTISMDVRSLVTAFAVNYDIILVSELQEIVATRNVLIYEGISYNASTYVNPNFPGMAPIYCVNFLDIDHCVVTLGAAYGLPFFNHVGSNLTFPEPCNCSELSEAYLADKFNECNMFEFISGVLVYNNISAVPLFEMAIKFSGPTGAFIANDYAYYASFVGSIWGKTSPYYDSMLNLPEVREELYDFCYLSDYGGCTLIIFSSFDMYNVNWAISDYYYSVPNGACRDSVGTTAENWQKLIDTPYAPLTQNYVECHNSPTTVLFNQVGVAVGNVSLLSPFGVLFVLVLIGLYQNLTGRAIPKTYSKAEKDSAIDALAVALLRARDEKRKQKINPEHDVTVNMITKLVDDLTAIAEQNEGHFYKQEEVDKFEVNWSAVVRAPFSRSQSRSQSSSFSGNDTAVELSNLEAQSGGGQKVVFQKKTIPTIQNRFPDLLILNIASSAYKGSTSLVSLRLSDVSRGGSEKLSCADVRSQLKELKSDTNSDVLYSQTVAALDALIEHFKDTYRKTPKKTSGSSSNKESKVHIAPEHVVLSDKTSVLNSIEALTRFQEIVTLNEADKDEDDEEVDDSSTSTVYLNKYITAIYKKIYALMLLHVGILVQSDGVGAVQNAYGEHVAYYVNNEVCTMSELKVKANV